MILPPLTARAGAGAGAGVGAGAVAGAVAVAVTVAVWLRQRRCSCVGKIRHLNKHFCA